VNARRIEPPPGTQQNCRSPVPRYPLTSTPLPAQTQNAPLPVQQPAPQQLPQLPPHEPPHQPPMQSASLPAPPPIHSAPPPARLAGPDVDMDSLSDAALTLLTAADLSDA
jgi:hypothetical protein